MTVLPSSIPHDSHPRIRELVAYWLSIQPAKGLPGRQHFDPLDIPSLLPNVFLVDVNQGEPAFTFRLMGTRIANLYGEGLTGQPFENAYEDGRSAPPYRDACRMINDKMPRSRNRNRGENDYMKDTGPRSANGPQRNRQFFVAGLPFFAS